MSEDVFRVKTGSQSHVKSRDELGHFNQPALRYNGEVKHYLRTEKKEVSETLGVFFKKSDLEYMSNLDAVGITHKNLVELKHKLMDLGQSFDKILYKVDLSLTSGANYEVKFALEF